MNIYQIYEVNREVTINPENSSYWLKTEQTLCVSRPLENDLYNAVSQNILDRSYPTAWWIESDFNGNKYITDEVGEFIKLKLIA
jgi:hypothetical protein